jgi:hypothetical protein
MAFRGMMLLRDEEDVIGQCLDHLLTWIDALYILDLGSTDRTWEIVQDYAGRDKRVVPLEHRPILYSDNMRGYIFHQVREQFLPGDWVMKIDADEFYHVAPPRFVRERLRAGDTAVHLQWYFFRLTTQEVADYESGRVDVWKDRQRPITDRRRFYKISEYAEPRMFKYRRSMRWPDKASFPFNAGFVARERIPIRHYPHRDPPQMERRFRLRAAMMKLSAHAGGHWKLEDWRKELVDEHGAAASAQGQRSGLAGESGIDTGPLHFWAPGTELAEQPLYNHVPPMGRRVTQRLIHPLLLPILDRRRPTYDPAASPPQPIPAEVQAELARDTYDQGANRA